MKHDMQKHYEDDLIEFHRDKGWFYVTPEESRKAFDALQAQIATEKAQRQAVSSLTTQADLEEWLNEHKDTN